MGRGTASGCRVPVRSGDAERAVELDELLVANATKPAREQPTLIRMFEELRGRGYDGGYDAVRGSGNVGRFADLGGARNEDPGLVLLQFGWVPVCPFATLD